MSYRKAKEFANQAAGFAQSNQAAAIAALGLAIVELAKELEDDQRRIERELDDIKRRIR